MFTVGIWAALGVAIGSFFIYGIFYWGGKALLGRCGKYFGLCWEDIEKIEKKFTAGYTDEITIFVLRAIPFSPIAPVSAFCGLVRVPWKTFGFYTFLGAIVRISTLGFIGWQLGEAYESFGDRFMRYENYGLVILLIIFVAFLFYAHRYHKRKREAER